MLEHAGQIVITAETFGIKISLTQTGGVMAIDAGAADIGGQGVGEIALHDVAPVVGAEKRRGIYPSDGGKFITAKGPVIGLAGFCVRAIGTVKSKGPADAVALWLELDDILITRTAGDHHGEEGERQRQAGAEVARAAQERLDRFHNMDWDRGIMLRAFIRIKRDWRGKGIIDLGI